MVGGGLLDETTKTEASCHRRCGTIKIPPWSKVVGAEYTCRTRSCGPSPMLPFQRNLLELDVQHETPRHKTTVFFSLFVKHLEGKTSS